MRGRSVGLMALAMAGLMATAAPGQAQTGRLGVELNKLEPGADGTGCRVFFLFRNGTGETFDAFEMSLALFDARGVIDRLLTVDAAPLPPSRTTLKLFDVPGLACDAVSEVLLHDLPACSVANRPGADCFGLIDLASKAAAPLVQ